MRSPLSLEDGRDSEEREVFHGFAYFPEYFQKRPFLRNVSTQNYATLNLKIDSNHGYLITISGQNQLFFGIDTLLLTELQQKRRQSCFFKGFLLPYFVFSSLVMHLCK